MGSLDSAEFLGQVAIIGMAGRFPGARSLDQYWDNLKNGVESMVTFTEEELRASGIDSSSFGKREYVRSRAIIEDTDLFDAAFFGYNPREAELTDPQQRVFLETAWDALEKAGYDPDRYAGAIGVYAGCGVNQYYLRNLLSHPELVATVGAYQTLLGNGNDYLTTRVSYKMNLRGPSMDVQTACSTSLVAVVLAYQALVSYQCDMALAGGVSLMVPQKAGYLHAEGMILSPDGHCRAFDADAAGTVGGEGVGVVVLKRLAEALSDRDHIHAVIRGGALNNDGSGKVGFTAPGVQGQAAVISMAQALAGVEPETVSYIEAHGTATPLGDPIEIAALRQVFESGSRKKRFCALGSVKTNIGHLDCAAGAAGLIKTVLALEHAQIPPSLHFRKPNPALKLEDSPFYVNTDLSDWNPGSGPRRAGVSSFGMGGTNAHVVLEEAPLAAVEPSARPWHLLPLSAKTETALERATANLCEHLRRHPDLELADVAFTLQVGRKGFPHRRFVVCRDTRDAIRALDEAEPGRLLGALHEGGERKVAFMFTGQGAQYVNMGRGLYESEPLFRSLVDSSADTLTPRLGLDLRSVLYPHKRGAPEAERLIHQTFVTQPALFTLEYALARQLQQWGVDAEAMIGHSIGEYVAACLAGVFPLEEALALVAERGRLMQGLPSGAMLAVFLSEEQVTPLLNGELSLAAVNGPQLCVLSGSAESIANLEPRLSERKAGFRRLSTSHAFHSHLMEPILEEFTARVARIRLRPPVRPYVSNLTGTWITNEQAMDPGYWARHLRQTVRFSEGLKRLFEKPETVLLEVGPGHTLGGLAGGQADGTGKRLAVSCLPSASDAEGSYASTMVCLGRLWLGGVRLDWRKQYGGERRRRLPLPSYPFERRRYWIEPAASGQPTATLRRTDLSDWFFAPSWRRAPLIPPGVSLGVGEHGHTTLVFTREERASRPLTVALRAAGQQVIEVLPGEGFAAAGQDRYLVDPGNPADYVALVRALREDGREAQSVLYLWSWGEWEPADAETYGFFGLIYLARAFGERPGPLQLLVVSSGLHGVIGGESLDARKALVVGPSKVIPEEFPQMRCRLVDVVCDAGRAQLQEACAQQLAAELLSGAAHMSVAYRGQHRWVQWFEPVRLPQAVAADAPLRQRGVYLVSGGLGGMGLSLAEHLATTLKARLILVGRSPFPARERWEQVMATATENDRTAGRIAKILSMEDQGAELLVMSADIADEQQMREVLRQSIERFGPLNGIIHAAGVAGGGIISLKEPEAARGVFSAKVRGTAVLERLTRGYELDFFALCSSLAAVLPTSGQVDYTAANAFLDAFANAHSGDARHFLAINWDTWSEVGMSIDTEVPAQFRQARAESLQLGIAPREGADAFRRALASGLPQLLVCARAYDLLSVTEKRATSGAAQEAAHEEAQPATAGPGRHARPALSTDFVAPQSEVAKRVAAIWGELLGIDQVGIHDSFFELGGHSLLATQTVSRIRESFSVELPLTRLFEEPTIAAFAGLIEAQLKAESFSSAKLVAADRSQDLPLSFAQHRLWFLDQFGPGNPAYNMPAAVRLSGILKVTALERALSEIARRHEALRTVFGSQQGRPVQVILEELPIRLPQEDLRPLPEKEQEREVLRQVQAESLKPFSLAQGPLIRGRLLRLADEQWVFILVMHHIISDGWSIKILFEELDLFYEAFGRDALPPQLPELPIQYADFAHWQRQRLDGPVLAEQLGYWLERLRGPLSALDLPTDRPRPALQSFGGAAESVLIARQLLDAARSFGQAENATLFMTLLAAFKILLHRYTGQTDVIVGSPIAGRDRVEIEKLIGFFVNTLVLRTDLSGDPSFREAVGRVRETALGAFDHQEVPFEKLVEELQPERDRSRNPLFQIFFNMADLSEADLKLKHLRVDPLETHVEMAKFDLTLYSLEVPQGLILKLNYNTDLFEKPTVVRLLEHFECLLGHGLAEPDRRISALRLLSENRRRELRAQRNRIHPVQAFRVFEAEEIDQSIHSRFAKQAQRVSTHIAVKSADVELTYAQLNAQADALAAELLERCGGEPQRVALLFGHVPALVSGILGTLKAGKTYVPLDALFPPQRLSHILEDVQCRVIVTDTNLESLARSIAKGAEVVNINRLAERRSPSVEVSPHALAYILYTSGSTGRPKGVMQSHRNVLQHIRAYTNALHLSETDKILQLASYTFDAAVMDIFGALLNGATLYLYNLREQPLADLGRWIEEMGITVYHSTTTVFRYFMNTLQERKKLGSLRLVVLGGEEVQANDVRMYQSHCPPGCLFVNGLGPSESTLALQYFVDHNTEVSRRSVPVGYPVEGTEILLLNEAGQPTDLFGEIAIRSPYVALGYWNQPELTASASVGQGGNGVRTYRSGDLGRVLADGSIEFAGRKDAQVKIRGYRIEPGEIEMVLCSHPGVDSAVVVAHGERAEPAGEKRLVAYVVGSGSVRLEELREYLRQRLPEYMVPSAYVALEHLPMTPHGKLDRLALPAPEAGKQTEAPYLAPRSETEKLVAEIWRELLGVEKVGIQDNFFNLGGHSLLATRLVSSIRERIEIELPLRKVFEAPTLAEMAGAIEAMIIEEIEALSDEEVERLADGST